MLSYFSRKIFGEPTKKLFYAIEHDDVVQVKLILENNSNVDVNNTTEDPFGYTPLIKAASLGRYKICKLLIVHGAKINQILSGREKVTALLAAANGCSGKHDVAGFFGRYTERKKRR